MGYVDANYARDSDDRRFTIGYVSTLGGGPICSKFMVQSLVALYIIKLEYMTVAKAAKVALWLEVLVKELGIQQRGVQFHCDSHDVVFLAKNHAYIARIKHIDVRFQEIRELVYSGELLFEKIHISKNAAHMLTKVVTMEKFKHCLDLINISR